MIASAVPDRSRDMQHNDSAHATAVLVASRADSAIGLRAGPEIGSR